MLRTSATSYYVHPLFSFRTSSILHSEHPPLFVSNIRHFMLRTSGIFRSQHLDDFCFEHPVFYISNFRFFHSGHPTYFTTTGWRNGHLYQMFVKKNGDEKGPPLYFILVWFSDIPENRQRREHCKTYGLLIAFATKLVLSLKDKQVLTQKRF